MVGVIAEDTMQEKFESFFVKALHDAKIAELKESYEKKGFSILNERGVTDCFDLVVSNRESGQITAFEVKVLPISAPAKANIDRLSAIAEERGYGFRLVAVARPRKHSNEIDWLDEALLKWLLKHPIPELDRLSRRTLYEHLSSDIRSINIHGASAKVLLDGAIEVTLQYGAESDQREDRWEHSESIPFEAELELDLPTKSIENANIKVDTSEYAA